MTPVLIIRDLELIKQILVKDFDHFLDHRGFIPEDAEPLFGKNLFSLTGPKWKDMRSTLSPAFTSSKMKFIFSLISQTGKQFSNYFLEKGEKVISLEMKETFAKFANDVIANAAFGIECNSLKDPDNEFYLMGREASDFTRPSKVAKFFLYGLSQTIYKVSINSRSSKVYLTTSFLDVKVASVSSQNGGLFYKSCQSKYFESRETQHCETRFNPSFYGSEKTWLRT